MSVTDVAMFHPTTAFDRRDRPLDVYQNFAVHKQQKKIGSC